MELRIDTRMCDLGDRSYAVPGYDAAALADPEVCREGRSMTLEIPRTPRNDAVLLFACDPHAAERFNAAVHTAELTAEGAVLMAGAVRLLSRSETGYSLEIRDGGARWAEQAARQPFNALDVEFRTSLTPEALCESWTAADPVKFFPVHRDEYAQQNASTDLLPAERLLATDDYFPFLHVATLVGRIFSGAGYSVRSDFFASDFFRSLYMSGQYVTHDTAAIESRMGFRARRLSEATAQANYMGRVYADPKALYNTLGNIVESAAATAVDADGEPVGDLFNNGGCFSMSDGKIVYTPPAEVVAGFEYRLRYTTDHRILSRTRLTGFDTFYLGPGSRIGFKLANRYEDRRGGIEPGYLYRVIVFAHEEGAQYRLTCTLDGVSGYVWCDFAARSVQVTAPPSGDAAEPVLWRKTSGVWSPYADDWALYDGHIGETGRTTVEVRLRTAAEAVSPDAPKYFDQIFIEGAEEGMSITLHKECSLRPRFMPGPGFGAQLLFADVAQHQMRQIVLLEALAHLFNLRFFSEPGRRTVWIEPADDFFSAGPEADWSDRTDFSQPVVRTEIAPETRELRTRAYQPGEGAVARFETERETVLGSWTFEGDTCAAAQGEEVRLNPLFRASLNSSGHYLNAPSARLLQVGDRDDTAPDTDVSPRIVRYAGMHPLPEGERWGYPSEQTAYPLAAFHFEGDARREAFTLCFEDRDGAEGLHRYYDRQMVQEATGERITLSLRIAPHEFENLFAPGVGAADVRSVFRIDTGAGRVRASLCRIEAYDPAAASVRCTFTRLPEMYAHDTD